RRHTRFSRDWSSDVCSSDLSTPPDSLLNGSHKYADGTIHLDLEQKEIPSSNLNKQWHYAAGIPSPHPETGKFRDGLSLVPPRSRSEERRVGKDCRLRTEDDA